jgi:hypothetical protein
MSLFCNEVGGLRPSDTSQGFSTGWRFACKTRFFDSLGPDALASGPFAVHRSVSRAAPQRKRSVYEKRNGDAVSCS